MHKKTSFVVLFLIATSSLLFSQEKQSQEHVPKEHAGHLAVIEIITSALYAFNTRTELGAFGTEFHLTYWENHIWGAGLGYTVLFEDEKEKIHQLAILGSYNPKEWITINAGPNFRLPNDHHDLIISGYVETEFNYRLRQWVHFGPLLGATIGIETDLSIGFQIGFEF
jgi:hypothetical protein